MGLSRCFRILWYFSSCGFDLLRAVLTEQLFSKFSSFCFQEKQEKQEKYTYLEGFAFQYLEKNRKYEFTQNRAKKNLEI